MYQLKPCGRPIHPAPEGVDKEPVCLMHSRDPQKSDDQFQEEFERVLKEAGAGLADFSGFVFPSAIYPLQTFAAQCVFSNATFTQGPDFYAATFTQNANFSAATFTQNANFSAATFTQNADFFHATFTQDAQFDMAAFTQNAQFGWATFKQDAEFSGATFTQHANFAGATFTQDADFSLATFTQDANFIGATFTEDARFSEATFTQDADFTCATFVRLVYFRFAKFLGPVEFRETGFRRDAQRLPGPVFSLAEFSQPEEVVFYKTYLGQALFHNCDVSKLVFSSVEWRKREGSGKRMVFEEDINLEHETAGALRPQENNPDQRDYGLIAELYQQLKKNYDDRKDYWTAGDFHFGEMEMKRLSSRRKDRALRGLHRYLGLVAWYKYASQYGESYVRPAFLLVGVLLAFALAYPAVGLHFDASKEALPSALSPPASSNPSASPQRSAPEKDLPRGRDASAVKAPGAADAPSIVALTYGQPLPPETTGSTGKWPARVRLFGHSFLTALYISTLQKELVYEPVYPWGRLLALLQLLVTSTLFALFLLALRRQFRR